MTDLRPEPPAVSGGEERRCEYRNCRQGPGATPGLFPPGSRSHRRFCNDSCRAAETRARNAAEPALPEAPTPPEVAPAPRAPRSAAQRFIDGLQLRRAAVGLPPLTRCPALALRAGAEAASEALAQKRVTQLLGGYQADIVVAAAVLPDEAAETAGDIQDALDPELTHFGLATLPVGDGEISFALVLATSRQHQK